jgi:hypothetical protein
VNSPEEGPVGPKHVEIRRYMNKIEIVTSVGFLFHMLQRKVLLPTDAQANCLKTSIKIYIKTTPTCFGVITINRERTI